MSKSEIMLEVLEKKPQVTPRESSLQSSSSEGKCDGIDTTRNDVVVIAASSRDNTKRTGWVKTAFRRSFSNLVTWSSVSAMEQSPVMVAETMSLGITSLPQAMNSLGLVIGPLLIILFGLVSFLCGLLLWKVKRRFPETVAYCDIMTKVFGTSGEVFAIGNNGVMLLFVMAGHIITWTEMVRVCGGTDTPCLVVIKAAGTGVMAFLSLAKRLRSLMPLYFLAAGSIITAAFILMVDGAVENYDLGSKAAFIIVPLRFLKFSVVASTISNVMISYAGHMAYFQIMDEMANVEDFWKSLSLASATITIQYTLIAVVAYKYFGQDVTSPALSSATPVVGKIAWTVSIPTIIVAGVIASQMLNNETLSIFWNKAQLQSDARKPSEKSVAVAELGSVEIDVNQQPIPHEVEPRPKVSRSREWTVRILTNSIWWTLAFILANVIPGFSNLLALLGALVGWSIVIGQPALMWLWMEWKPVRKTTTEGQGKVLWKKSIRLSYLQDSGTRLWFYLCIFLVLLWPVAAVAGVYGSAVLVKLADAKDGVFACETSVR